jgi:hypothetical protein
LPAGQTFARVGEVVAVTMQTVGHPLALGAVDSRPAVPASGTRKDSLSFIVLNQGILKGKYHCTIDLLFDWFGLVCFANKNKNCQLSYN